MVIGYTEKKTAVAKYCSVTVQKCTHKNKLKIEEACKMVHKNDSSGTFRAEYHFMNYACLKNKI